MTHVTLSCGFEADIDETAVQDMEFLDALTEMQDGDPTGLSRMCGMLMEKADKKKLYEMISKKEGRATVEAVGKQITELLEQLQSKKK